MLSASLIYSGNLDCCKCQKKPLIERLGVLQFLSENPFLFQKILLLEKTTAVNSGSCLVRCVQLQKAVGEMLLCT